MGERTDKHTKRIKGPEIDPNKYRQLILRRSKGNSMEKGQSFQQMVTELNMQKKKKKSI